MTLLRLALTLVQDASGFSSMHRRRFLRSGNLSRRFSSVGAVEVPLVDNDDELLHPDNFGEIPYPTSLSPSAVMEVSESIRIPKVGNHFYHMMYH